MLVFKSMPSLIKEKEEFLISNLKKKSEKVIKATIKQFKNKKKYFDNLIFYTIKIFNFITNKLN